MKKIIYIIVLVLLALILWGAIKHKPVAVKPYKIGVILPLTGEAAVSGEKLQQGVLLAQKELDPLRFQIIIEDDHTKTADGITAAKKLLEVDNVDVLVGLYIPDEVVAVAPLAKEKGVAIFSASYCASTFKDLNNVFCGYPTAINQLRTGITAIKDKNVKSLALLNTNDDFGIDSRDSMVKLTNEGGYSVSYNELVPFGTKDLKSQVVKIIKSKADAVFMASGDTAQAFTLMKLLQQQGYKGMRITFVDINKKALADFKGFVEGTFAPGMAPSQFSSDFTSRYETSYGKVPEDYVPALGYDITKIVTNIMAASNFIKNNIVNEAVSYKYTNPAIKNFGYQPDHSINFGLELWTVRGGEYVKAN